ncbi:uncharacterized protein LAESUDRAFT_753411 [Laetiporus sulphureus 93-53]|uniref:DUF6534 domain-containing protein n=1 Tax=Laetiporus sulphureus 93-53 TaxID=1314785 RepID=A0A165B070_9APHY|nr:uncharacterized protein LAESUDRAFT_753411 [Laetiporus sulphureus 93-53]KZS99980.1 hypothetical protein LAESUDRAFT_753411 [Laetiporus sulphureus 93-53]
MTMPHAHIGLLSAMSHHDIDVTSHPEFGTILLTPVLSLLCLSMEPLLGDSLGAVFVGNIIAAVIYGITNVQAYIYYKQSTHDPIYLKCLVFFLWSIDGLHLIVITHLVYTYAVRDFGNIFALLKPTCILGHTRSAVTQVLVTAISDGLIRGFFGHRVWKLRVKNVLGVVVVTGIVVSSVLAFVAAVILGAKMYRASTYGELYDISWVIYVGLAACVVADVLIAASQCFLLRARRTSVARSRSVVRVLMLYSINTGSLTSLCELACLITYAVMPDNFIYMGIYFTLTKFFFNSLLATLNAREGLRRKIGGGLVAIPLVQSPGSSAQQSSGQTHGIQVHTTVEVKADGCSRESLPWKAPIATDDPLGP